MLEFMYIFIGICVCIIVGIFTGGLIIAAYDALKERRS